MTEIQKENKDNVYEGRLFFFTIKYKFVITVAQIQETKKIQ